MGPLSGFRVVELAGLGPAPFCAMLLSDMGAEVVRIDRLRPNPMDMLVPTQFNLLLRGRRSVGLHLKTPAGVDAALRLVEKADVLIEGYRPGVAERLGLGPETCLARNERLVYGRVTGWGRDGPLAQAAGHDINYVALSGALHAIGSDGGPPVPPLNLLGDFGGGALYLAFGVASALVEVQKSGVGQVVDATMVDGVASLCAMVSGLQQGGLWSGGRGTNFLDGGAPFYAVYETSDGEHVAIGAIEPQFYQQLIQRMELTDAGLPGQMDRSRWPELREHLADAFRSKTLAQWRERLEGTDGCFAPVVPLAHAPEHPHLAARGTFVDVDGVTHPAPAPRLSRTPGAIQGPPGKSGQDTEAVLGDWGFTKSDIAALREAGAIT